MPTKLAENCIMSIGKDTVWFDFCSSESKGRIGVSPQVYGPQILIDLGTSEPHLVGFFDLYPPAQNEGPPRFLLERPGDDDNLLAKLLIEPTRRVLIVSSAPSVQQSRLTVNNLGDYVYSFATDRAFTVEGLPEEEHANQEEIRSVP